MCIRTNFTIESGFSNPYNIFNGEDKTEENCRSNKGWLDNSLSFVTWAKRKGDTEAYS